MIVKLRYEEYVEGESNPVNSFEDIVLLEKLNIFEKVKNMLLEGKEDIDIVLNPEEAYGNRDPSKIVIVPYSEFRKNKITPRPGMLVRIDGRLGVIRICSGGRVIVDFNHPLAGRKIRVKCKVVKKYDSIEGAIKDILNALGVMFTSVEVGDKEIRIILPLQIPSNVEEYIKRKVSFLSGKPCVVEVKEKEEGETVGEYKQA